MMSGKAKLTLIVLLSLTVLFGVGLVAWKISRGRRDTPLTRAPPTALNVLHFNDGYDVRSTPRFLTRWLERKDKDTLTLFSGDIISPSLVSNQMKGDQFIPFLKFSDTQLAVPGNHEYDFGEEVFEAWMAKGSTKWILANLKMKSDPTVGASKLVEHDIRTLNGWKVGVFGLVDTNWQKSCKLDASKFEYEPFDEAAKRKAAELRKLGADLVFVISHMANVSDEKLLSDDNGVDMVFGGHDHIFYLRRINNKILLKSGTDFDNFSQTKLFFTDKPPGGDYCDEKCADFNYLLDEELNDDQVFFNFTLPRGNRYLNVAIEKVKVVAEDPRHSDMQNYIHNEVDPKIHEFLQPMVRVDTKLDTRETTIQDRETAVGNFFADLARAHYGTDLGLVNAGIFKSEKLFDKNIFLRKIDLMKIFPYKRDVFITVDLKGSEILEVLEDSLKPYPKPSPRFLSFSGLTYEVNPHAEPGKRVVEGSAHVDEVPLDLEKSYSVAMVSGLKHPQFGIELLKTKEPTNPEAERLEPAALFEHFTKLPEVAANVQEFEVLKKQFPNHTYSKIVSIPVKTPENPVERFTYDGAEAVGDTARLHHLSPEALKRLRSFALAGEVVNVDGRNIWAISPVVDKRFKLVGKVIV